MPVLQNTSGNAADVFPLKLEIPAISVNATIQSVGLKSNGSIGTPNNYTDAAWFNLSPEPGAVGTAIITGHLDTKLSPYAVFFNLDKLKPGDEIRIINSNGQEAQFKVTGSKIYNYLSDPVELFEQTDKKRIALITCTGNWLENEKTYDQRLVVFGEMN